MDPSVIEGVDVARGPGLGRLRIRRLWRRDLRAHAPRRAGFASARPASAAPSARAFRKSAAPSKSRRACAAAASCSPRTRATPTTGTAPRDRGVQLGLPAITASSAASSTGPAPARSRPAGRATSAATSSARATTRRRCGSTTRPETRTASPPATTPTTSWASSGSASPASSGRFDQGPIRIASPPRPPAAPSSGPTFPPRTSTCAASGARLFGKARLEVGLDVNGRLRPARASTISSPTTWPASLVSDAAERVGRYGAPHRHRRVCVDRYAPSRRCSRSAPASAATTSRPATRAATSAIARPATAPAPAMPSATLGSSAGFSLTGAGRARLPRSRAVGSLLSRTDGTRLHHRQSRPRSRDEPAVRPRAALHGARLPHRRVLLPLPHRRPDRALLDRHRLLLLPQPRHGAHQAASRSKARPMFAARITLDLAAQVAEGQALDDDAVPRRHVAGQLSRRPCASSSANARSARSAPPTSRTTITSGRPNVPSPATLCSTPPRATVLRGRSSCGC